MFNNRTELKAFSERLNLDESHSKLDSMETTALNAHSYNNRYILPEGTISLQSFTFHAAILEFFPSLWKIPAGWATEKFQIGMKTSGLGFTTTERNDIFGYNRCKTCG